MNDTNNGWPDKPGVPLNPERDGWHWVKARPEKLSALREKFPALWTAGNQHWIRGTYAPEYAAENWLYLGPCLTPDEATALQRRIKELEAALGFYADKNSWVNSVSLGHPQIDGMTSLVELDKGDKARAALAAGKE